MAIKKKIGILGFGHLGKIHAACLQKTKFEFAGFYDPSTTIPESAYSDYHRFESIDDLLAACDAVDIVSTTATHYEMILKALDAGKHVFVEKPYVNNLEHGEHIGSVLKDQDIVFQIGHVERFNPAYLNFEKKLQPKFIEGHRLAQFNPRGNDASVILDLMIHDIDLVLDLVNSDVADVQANGVCIISELFDICNARITFTNGCVANLTASRISMKQMRKLRIFQKDAYVSIDFLNKETQVFRLFDDAEAQRIENFESNIELETLKGTQHVVIESPQINPNNAIAAELNEFHDSIVHNTKVRVGIHEGLSSLRLAAQIYNKAKENEHHV